jgi:hypothetical protein
VAANNETEPGGYIQWREVNIPQYVKSANANPVDPAKFPANAALQSFVKDDMASDGQSTAWVTKLPVLLQDQGIEPLFTQAYDAPKRYLRVWTELLLHLMEELAASMNKKELSMLVLKASEEVGRGCVNVSPFPIVVVGKKPLGT